MGFPGSNACLVRLWRCKRLALEKLLDPSYIDSLLRLEPLQRSAKDYMGPAIEPLDRRFDRKRLGTRRNR